MNNFTLILIDLDMFNWWLGKPSQTILNLNILIILSTKEKNQPQISNFSFNFDILHQPIVLNCQPPLKFLRKPLSI